LDHLMEDTSGARGVAARLSFVAALFLFAAALVAGLALVAPR
jgi:hypothetical protein